MAGTSSLLLDMIALSAVQAFNILPDVLTSSSLRFRFFTNGRRLDTYKDISKWRQFQYTAAHLRCRLVIGASSSLSPSAVSTYTQTHATCFPDALILDYLVALTENCATNPTRQIHDSSIPASCTTSSTGLGVVSTAQQPPAPPSLPSNSRRIQTNNWTLEMARSKAADTKGRLLTHGGTASSMTNSAIPRRRSTLRELHEGRSATNGEPAVPKVINAAPSLEKAEMYGIDNERPASSKIMALFGRMFMETIPQILVVGAMLSLIFGGCCSNVSAPVVGNNFIGETRC